MRPPSPQPELHRAIGMEDLRPVPVDRFVDVGGDRLADAAVAWDGPQPSLAWDGQDRPAIRWDGTPAHLIGLPEVPPEGLPDLPPSADEDWPEEDRSMWEAWRPMARWASMSSCEEEEE